MSGYSIPVNQQVYDGYQFRSTLEARYAFVFNHYKLDYDYEPKMFEFPLSETSPLLPTHPSKTIKYIPDFFLPQLNAWIEVKPYFPKPIEMLKAFLVAVETQQKVFICWNHKKGYIIAIIPPNDDPVLGRQDSTEFELGYSFKRCSVCKQINIVKKHGYCTCDLYDPNNDFMIKSRRLMTNKQF
tara:strand:+ start:337 stop:888 length:552 start_codon:yes stop_codon:yes gene_type:complete